MLQHLLRRLVFDVPILNEYAKMPLKVCLLFIYIYLFKLLDFYFIYKIKENTLYIRNSNSYNNKYYYYYDYYYLWQMSTCAI